MRHVLYFDHAATTPVYDEVVETVAVVMRDYFANPSSMHKLGQQAGKLVEAAREQVAGLFGVAAGEVVFTSSGTESNATAILGVARQFGATRGRHVVTTPVEHPSVLAQMDVLRAEGFEVTEVPVDANGRVNIADVAAAMRTETILVSVGWVASEVGAVQPVAEIGALLRAWPKALFHVDAVQAVGKLDVDMHAAGVDLLSASAHKFGGPRGAGLLLVRDGVALQALLAGGDQEHGRRAGTPNTAAIAGMAKALRLTLAERAAANSHVRALHTRLREQLAAADATHGLGLALTGSAGPVGSADLDAAHPGSAAGSPYIVHFTVPGLKAQVLLHALEQRDIFVSSRTACSSRDERPSPTLLAMGHSRESALSGIRISFHPSHTTDDVDQLADTLVRVIQQLRKEASSQ
jgi:cysteine desulfurase